MIAVLAGLNLAVIFGVELAGLVAFGVWGAHAVPEPAGRWFLALTAPIAAAALWGLFCAPKATIPIPDPAAIAIKLVLLAAATIALISISKPLWGIALATVALTTALLAYILPDPFST